MVIMYGLYTIYYFTSLLCVSCDICHKIEKNSKFCVFWRVLHNKWKHHNLEASRKKITNLKIYAQKYLRLSKNFCPIKCINLENTSTFTKMYIHSRQMVIIYDQIYALSFYEFLVCGFLNLSQKQEKWEFLVCFWQFLNKN